MRAKGQSLVQYGRQYAGAVRARVDRIGWPQSERARVRDASRYWTQPAEQGWEANSHWRSAFDDSWDAIGRETLGITQLLARVLDSGLPAGRTVEWGAGGGANAVHLAPLCREFVAVDVAQGSLDECARQVARACDTPVLTELIDVDNPESVLSSLGRGSCDLFVCFNVMELLPSPAYGLRLLAIASELLREGGVAVVQIKYATSSDPLSRSRRRAYRRNMSDMTSYGIDEFWVEAANRGLTPMAVHLVPENWLDRRYAYFLLVKETVGDGAAPVGTVAASSAT